MIELVSNQGHGGWRLGGFFVLMADGGLGSRGMVWLCWFGGWCEQGLELLHWSGLAASVSWVYLDFERTL